jgi:hypothetical protein
VAIGCTATKTCGNIIVAAYALATKAYRYHIFPKP